MAVAVALHVAVGAVLIQALTFGHGIPAWLDFGDQAAAVEERLTYVAPEAPAPRRPALPRRGAAGHDGCTGGWSIVVAATAAGAGRHAP